MTIEVNALRLELILTVFTAHSNLSVVCLFDCIELPIKTGRRLIYVKLICKFKDYFHLDQVVETERSQQERTLDQTVSKMKELLQTMFSRDEFNDRHPAYACMATNNCYDYLQEEEEEEEEEEKRFHEIHEKRQA
uniref:Uncharacterized protein n=1 Tax=Glossina pallidipes TaxID=7398 RepID=A0A1A9ZTU6_GLOPL